MPLPKTPKVKVPPLSVAAPNVMTRSGITDLANRVRQSEGQYGAQRVERAADEIPNLEKLYQDQALMRAFTGDNAQALMTMKPSDFERFAAPLDANLSDRSLQKIADITGFYNNGGFSDVPYLYINKKEQGTTGLPWITGHEGRHRNRVMDAAGEQAGLVQLLPRAELREPFPRRSQEQYIEALYKEMQLTGNRVKPERYDQHITDDANRVVDIKDVQRRAIDLPDLYAQGGLVDSAPEEAIKNTIKDPQAFRMLDMDLANLALMNQQPQRMAGGGAVNMDEGGLLQNAFRAFVPSQVRTFVGTLAGDESPITEKNFSGDELDQMRKAIMSSRQDRTAMNARLHHEAMQNAPTAKERRELFNRGPSKELDQTVGYQHYPGSPTDLISDFSLSSDAAIRNTLGRFAYEKTPEGNLVAKDLYKFRGDQSDKTRPTSDYADMGTAAKLWTLTKDTFGDAGLQTLPSRTGNAFLGNKPGRPVNVNLGKAPFAPGGAVHMEHGGITPRAFSYSPTNRDEHNRKLGLPAEFYRAGQTDPTMQSYGAGVSVPVGEARLTADAIATRNAQMRDTLAGIMLGAEFPVGEGTLRAEMMRPTMQGASPQYGLRYSRPFAKGGIIDGRPIFTTAQTPFAEYRHGIGMAEGGRVNIESGIDINREYNPFSVLEKPTYGSEVPSTTPSIDQQRYELTMKGRQEAENRRYRAQQGDALAGVDPTGTLAVTDAARTMGLGMLALPVHAGRSAFHYLQHGNMKNAPTGKDYEELMSPRTAEGAELVEEIGTAGSRLTGSEMGFGLNPTLWAYAPPTVAQMRAGLKLGAERAAPVIKDIGAMANERYLTGKMPGMVAPNAYMVEPSAPKPAKALAPANEQGFYSPTEAAALNLQRKSGNGQSFLNDIMKGDNVSSEEINAMGLDTFLKDKKNVTAAEVQDYIAQNKLGLGEAVYDDKPKPNFMEFLHQKGIPQDDVYRILDKAENGIFDKQVAPLRDEWLNSENKSTKFKHYSLPGGENYREVVLTLPEKGRIPTFGEWHENTHIRPLSELEKQPTLLKMARERYEKEKNNMPKEGNYRSGHFDEPNILAHLRMSDRVTDGKKTLLVDEVQSDWHQAGREQGYKGGTVELAKGYKWDQSAQSTLGIAEKDPAWTATDRNGNLLGHYTSENAAKEALSERTSGVPNAPYKEDWYQLALRRAVKEAIDGGYDRVALPTGARVADRFDLSKQVESISHQKNPDGTYKVVATDKNGRAALNDTSVPQDKLSSIVGKEVAQKIIDAEGKAYPEGSVSEGMKKLSGLDLQVGGEGMKKYYDEIYPGYLKKFGKKYGASVGSTTVDAGGVAEPLHYMDITPAMRKEFSTGIHMKKGGKVSFADSLDAMRHELTKAK